MWLDRQEGKSRNCLFYWLPSYKNKNKISALLSHSLFKAPKGLCDSRTHKACDTGSLPSSNLGAKQYLRAEEKWPPFRP